MTGEEHYTEAERLLELAWLDDVRVDGPYAMFCVQSAMAHYAAATAWFTARSTPGVRLAKEM